MKLVNKFTNESSYAKRETNKPQDKPIDKFDEFEVYLYYRKESSITYSLKQALAWGLVERDIKGKKKPYALTKKGKEFLKLMS